MLEDKFFHVVARTWIAQSSDHLAYTYKFIRHFYKRTTASIIRLCGRSDNYFGWYIFYLFILLFFFFFFFLIFFFLFFFIYFFFFIIIIIIIFFFFA